VTAARPQAPRLTSVQMERYSRRPVLERWASEGQAKLLSSKVLIVGAGGLGSPFGACTSGCGSDAGDPRPPAPTINTLLLRSFAWPSRPISSSTSGGSSAHLGQM